MQKQDRRLVIRAASIIKQTALDLADSYMVEGGWQSKDQDIKLEYLQLLQLAEGLTEIVERKEA